MPDALPIDPFLPQIAQTLRDHRTLVLVAEPGAGKTTRVPPAILKGGLLSPEQPNLVMLQPRRIATRAAAERIAGENGWSLGDEVGYQVRFEKKMTHRTRLRVVTEAILTRQLIDDPSLEGVGCVVIDEFHERSIHSDLAIAFLKEVRQSLREDLLIVVMSATLDADPVSRFLGDAPILRVPGRTFPVDISYKPTRGAYLEDAVAQVVMDQPDDGHVLVFLPGAMEIQRAQQAINDRMPGRCILPLHGSLSFDKQQRAVAPSREPKIVLATNIAETSLTIEGVRCVIDSGLARRPSFDPQRGLDSLNLERISQASATQRAGRAGRTAAGRCIRLWTEMEQNTLDLFDAPEIARIDLAPTLLDLLAWGQADPHAFAWYDPPPTDSIENAERLLTMLGALDARGKLTDTGRRMQAMPVHPRLARLLIGSPHPKLGATVAAILSEKDFVKREWTDRNAIGSNKVTSESDVEVRLHLLEDCERVRFARGRVPEGVDAFAAVQVARVRDQLLRMSSSSVVTPERDSDSRLVQRLALLAYPDRVCRRRTDPRTGTMVGGVGVRLDTDCSVLQGDYFVAVDPRQDDRARHREAWVRIASAVDVAWLEELFPQSISRQRVVELDELRGRVVARTRIKYLDLVLREASDSQIDPTEAGEALALAMQSDITRIVAQSESLTALVARVRFLSYHLPGRGFPELDDSAWQGLLIEAAVGKVSKEQVLQSLHDTLRNRFAYPLDRLLEQEAPETIEVPTGSKIKLQYNVDATQPPVLAVRLQELFGMTQTPRIAERRVPVLLHLLGPNHRPVQVTQDLASFWQNTYPQVRKDLRAQYPRHSWPDDPLTADPIRGAKRRGKF